MASSLIKALPVIVVIMTAASDDLQEWGVNYSPSYVCALKGSTVKISCTVKYPRDYEIRTSFWTKTIIPDGEPPDLCSDPEKRGRVQCHSEDEDTHSITLINVTEADKHIYYCRFITDRERGRWTGIPGAQLDVTDLQVDTQQRVNEGGSVTLRCKSSCSLSEQTFIWFRNTERLTDTTENQLQLQRVSQSDTGNYRCAVRGNDRLISPAVYLKVGWINDEDKWGVSYSPSYVCALKGSTVKISCTVKYPSGHTLVKTFWTKTIVSSGETPDLRSDPEKSGRVQCHSEDKDTHSITLTDVTEADKHIYYCRFITNKDGGRWTGITGVQLDVTDLQVDTQQRVNEGDSVTLRCKSSCSLSEQTFIWFRNTVRLTNQTENQLQLQRVNKSDTGNYQCAVRGNDHLISPAVYLNVEYPPRSVSVSVSPSGEIVEGDSVTLNCNSDSNPPALNFIWFKGGKFLDSGDTYSITDIKPEASGNYYCSARNRHGSQSSASVDVNVMYPPRSVSVSVSPSGEIVEGDSVTLNCNSDSNPPALNFSWFKENETSSVGSGQSFSISSFNSSFSGRFSCEAHNKHGSQRSASVSLALKGVQRFALHAVSGIVALCGGLIFIIIIILIILIVFIKKKRRNDGAEIVRQKQEDRSGSAETAPNNDVTLYSPVSANQTDDLYAKIQAKKPKRSERRRSEHDSGDVEGILYASVHNVKKKTERYDCQTIETPDAGRSEDVIYSSVK